MKYTSIVVFGIIVTFFLMIFVVQSVPDGKLHVVFCNVGQGDAIYIRFPDGADMLVDAGPGKAVMSCLGEHMAFWDRTIELVALTHPQADHYGGLLEVFKRYSVDMFLAPAVDASAESYQDLKQLVQEKQIPVQNVYAGEIIDHTTSQSEDNKKIQLFVLSPDRTFVDKELDLPDAHNVLGFKTTKTDLNNFSLVMILRYGDYEVLLTGDAEADILVPVIKNAVATGFIDISKDNIEVLKVPHHGSEGSVTEELLDLLRPEQAVISVGKNSYGHPSEKITDLLNKFKISVTRLDVSESDMLLMQ